jgi:hypothetical protein
VPSEGVIDAVHLQSVEYLSPYIDTILYDYGVKTLGRLEVAVHDDGTADVVIRRAANSHAVPQKKSPKGRRIPRFKGRASRVKKKRRKAKSAESQG